MSESSAVPETSATSVNGRRNPRLATRLVSARPIRSEEAGEHLAATLESLGASPAVVEAAKKA